MLLLGELVEHRSRYIEFFLVRLERVITGVGRRIAIHQAGGSTMNAPSLCASVGHRSADAYDVPGTG